MGCVYICIYSTECKNLFDISHLINIKSSRLRKDVAVLLGKSIRVHGTAVILRDGRKPAWNFQKPTAVPSDRKAYRGHRTGFFSKSRLLNKKK